MQFQYIRQLQEVIEKWFNPKFDFDDQKHYDVLYFEKRHDFEILMKKIEEINVDQRRSTWYGDMADAVSILTVGLVKTMREKMRVRNWEKRSNMQYPKPPCHYGEYKHPIVFIAPLQLTNSHMIGAFEEYTQAFKDLHEYLDSPQNIFADKNTSFSVYISVRFTQLEDQKIRRLFLTELLEAIIRAVEELDYGYDKSKLGPNYVKIGMHTKDAQQTGLETLKFKSKNSIETGTNLSESTKFSNIHTTVQDLRDYHSELRKVEPLIMDAVIFANDNNLLRIGNKNRLQFHSTNLKSICGYRSIDPGRLKEALKNCDRNGPEVKNILESNLDSAVNRLIFMFNAFGVGFELPVKYIKSRNMLKRTKHLYKLSRNEQEKLSRNEEEKKNVSKNNCILQAYNRRVKSTDGEGYRVQTFNFIYWIILTIAVAVTVAYILDRKPEAKVEDIVQTVVALLTVIVTGTTTIILNTTYKGEKLGDILTNIRDIDTQDEFALKVWKQTSDIIEVLRMSHEAPKFLGGSENTSFTRKRFANAGLQPEYPITFSNIEAIGYGLFETAGGELFMIDQWRNVYRVDIIDNDKEYLEFDKDERERENKYLAALEEDSALNTNLENTTSGEDIHPQSGVGSSSSEQKVQNKIDCNSERTQVVIPMTGDTDMHNSPNALLPTSQTNSTSNLQNNDTGTSAEEDQLKRLTLHFTYLDAKIEQDFSLDQTTFGSKEDICCMRVKLSQIDSNSQIILSRVLPYQSRYRFVGTMRRYYRLNVSRERIENRDLYRMDVGIRKKRKQRPGRVDMDQNNQNAEPRYE